MWRPLTSDGETHSFTWSPDGKHIAFGASRGGRMQVFLVSADGGSERQITSGADRCSPPASSPDGRRLACIRFAEKSVTVVFVTVDGSLPPVPLASGARNEIGPAFSPDGRWVAHGADVDGYRLFVTDAAGSGKRWAVSTGEGAEAVWSRSGRQLFYRAAGKFYVVDIEPGPEFRASRPRLLFELPAAATGTTIAQYDVATGGSGFIVTLDPPETAAQLEIVYVPDWADEVREKLKG